MPALTPPAASRTAIPQGSQHRGRVSVKPAATLRVLQIAVACHPHTSMETRIGWRRAVQAAQRHDVTVLHGQVNDQALLCREAARLGLSDRLRFVPIERCSLGAMLCELPGMYYAGYRLWHAKAGKMARQLHREKRFDLVHQTTYCGYREPGDGWRLDAPFVWGPIGGTQHFPIAYLNQLAPLDAGFEVCRNVLNALQLRYSPRVRRATKQAKVLVAATHRAAADLHHAHGRTLPVRLETSLETPIATRRVSRSADEPLRILWAGRLRAWKALPLLLQALPQLSRDLDWRLRVLGVGPCGRRWHQLASRLGIADRIEWVGWPSYRETLPSYSWADVFAFTSLRDTSGTGLLEALAAGAPIVGVDHQGAADIMTRDCAIPIAVSRPSQTVQGFADALTRLYNAPEEWQRLSDGARQRAAEFTAVSEADDLHRWYQSATSRADQGHTVASLRSTKQEPSEATGSLVAACVRNPKPI